MILKCTDFLNEKMGIHEQGEILSDFLIKFLDDAEPDKTYVFVKPGSPEGVKYPNSIIINSLPELNKNIYKVVVEYSIENMGGIQALFDPGRSKYTKEGFILFFRFLHNPGRDKIWKHHIYHEIHHGMQFLEMGKKRMSYSPKNLKVTIMRNFKGNIIFEQFMQFLYHTINFEQGAFIPQFYGKLKYRKNIKNINDLKKYFKKRNIYEYRTVYNLAYIDLNKLFNTKARNPDTGEIFNITNKDEMIQFFTLLKAIGSKISEYDNVEDLFKNFQSIKIEEKDFISESELEATIKKYNKYFHKIGMKMMKKLDKTYDLLYDYYIKKFEEEKEINK